MHVAAPQLCKQSADTAASNEEAHLSCCSTCHRQEGLRPNLPLPLLEQGLPCSVLPGSNSPCLWPLQLQPARPQAPVTICPSQISLLRLVQATLCLCISVAWPCAAMCHEQSLVSNSSSSPDGCTWGRCFVDQLITAK